ncbi:MAG: hypothetical protein HY791_06940 [Deltaproteobacteria bacterium]|nr:hypothetical protein [Deltaproteobacteria bacterium]
MLSVVFLAAAAMAQTPDPSARIEAHVFAARPLALATGLARGGGIQISTGVGPFEMGARARMGSVEENDLVFSVAHTELAAGLAGGYTHAIGVGRVGMGVVAELQGVREVRSRHQAERLARSGLELDTQSWALGVSVGFEVGMSVRVSGPWSVGVAGGPTLTKVGSSGARLGWVGAALIAFDLGGGS